MPYGTTPYDVSEGEMRWQVYTSLALGAKGVLYFCYWSPVNDHTFLRGQAIMTPRAMELGKAPTIDQQVPSQKYPIVQRLNSKLKVLGNFLLKKDSSAVLQLHGPLRCQLPASVRPGSLGEGNAARRGASVLAAQCSLRSARCSEDADPPQRLHAHAGLSTHPQHIIG